MFQKKFKPNLVLNSSFRKILTKGPKLFPYRLEAQFSFLFRLSLEIKSKLEFPFQFPLDARIFLLNSMNFSPNSRNFPLNAKQGFGKSNYVCCREMVEKKATTSFKL